MLTLTLRDLERDGLVTRTVFPDPAAGRYEFTDSDEACGSRLKRSVPGRVNINPKSNSARARFDRTQRAR